MPCFVYSIGYVYFLKFLQPTPPAFCYNDISVMNKDLSALQKPLQPLLEQIRNTALQHGETIAVAESVTAGCVQLLLSTAMGAQDFFEGGINVYNNAQKAAHLNIDRAFADSCDGVHPRIARHMAQNVSKLFKVPIGIGITGYATKSGEVKELYAYVALCRSDDILCEEKILPAGEGIEAQWDYAVQVLRLLSAALESV